MLCNYPHPLVPPQFVQVWQAPDCTMSPPHSVHTLPLCVGLWVCSCLPAWVQAWCWACAMRLQKPMGSSGKSSLALVAYSRARWWMSWFLSMAFIAFVLEECF